MGQVLANAVRRLPDVEARLTETAALELELGQASDDASRQGVKERLQRLCAGRDPAEAVAMLRAFRNAVQAGDGLEAASRWVECGPLLQGLHLVPGLQDLQGKGV